jgi:ribosomal protein S27E
MDKNTEEEYIEIDGKTVNKKLYEDFKSLKLHCPHCKSNENKLVIGSKDVVFISCAKCGHSLTYGMHQTRIIHGWEYKIIRGEEEELNALGAEGWEAFAAVNFQSDRSNGVVYYTEVYLKRKTQR